jgi:membrane protease YdiL (CAAX protease family)
MSIHLFTPYIILGLSIIGLFCIRSARFLRILIAGSLGVAFASGIMNLTGLAVISAFWGICELHWRNLSPHEGINSLRLAAIVAVALGFASHMIPGFHNLQLWNALKVSENSLPYNMYLNFDKTIAAVILVLAKGLLVGQPGLWGKRAVTQTAILTGGCIALIVPLAVVSGYVHFDPKFPDVFWMWALNNLIFVCFAEEVIFRGVIQNHFVQVASRWQISPTVPLMLTALLFGLMHFQGGIAYIAFATIAGLFYGYAYHRTGRLESAIAVHFLLNLCHFLLFTYPAAAIAN